MASVRRANHDMRHILHWHKLAFFLGIIPFSDWLESSPHVVLAKIRVFSVLTVVSVACVWSCYERWNCGFYLKKRPAGMVMDLIAALSLEFCFSVAFVEMAGFKARKLRMFLAKLELLGRQLRSSEAHRKETFKRQVFLLHVYLMVCTVIALGNITTDFGFCVGKTFFYREIQIYYNVLTTVLIYNYCTCLRARFSATKVELVEVVESHVGSTVDGEWLQFRSRKLIKIYSELVQMMVLFNTIFGWQMLAIALKMTTDTLHLIATGVFLVGIGGLQKAAIPIALFSLKVSLSWILVILLATSCNKATKEVREAVAISYKLMHELRSIEPTRQSKRVHQELFLLAQKITVSSPHVSAAGFFPVDYTMLFMLIGCVTSYLIVLIQFNK